MLLENIFKNILDMSITASYVAIVVIIIRFVIKKMPKSFSFALWIVVLFRLVCPISFISKLSLFNLINRDGFRKIDGVSKNITVNNSISNISTTEVSNNNAANYTVDNLVNNTQGFEINFTQIVAILWIIGILILIMYFIVSYIKTYSRIKTATLCSGNIYESDQINTAFVFGLFRPKIYIPINLTNQEKIYIIEHEKVHLKRKDYLIKIIAFLLLAVHWFNPIMWISFILMDRDMEMSCDEKVMKNLGEDIRTDYSYSLLNLAVNKNNTFNVPISFSENSIKSRIKNILRYKKPKKSVILIVVLLIAVFTLFLISNPKDDRLDNKKEREETIVGSYYSLAEESDASYIVEIDWKFDFDNKPYQELEEGDFYYLVNKENKAVITYYKGNQNELVIPNTLGKYPVTMIYDDAFSKLKYLQNVTIPEGVEAIGSDSFSECPNLKKVIMLNSLKIIGNTAFSSNDNLNNIIIPGSVTKIGLWAFAGNQSLSNVTLSDGLITIGDSMFFNCKSLKNITIPNSVKTIEPLAFSGTGFSEITIPEGVTTIGDEVFSNCDNLVKVTIPKSVTKIGKWLFRDCPNKVVIYGEKDSYAETYANNKDIPFKEIIKK